MEVIHEHPALTLNFDASYKPCNSGIPAIKRYDLSAIANFWGGRYTRPMAERAYLWIARHRQALSRTGLDLLSLCRQGKVRSMVSLPVRSKVQQGTTRYLN